MAVPKRKVSKSRRDKRRGFDKLIIKNTSVCNSCGQDKLPHHMCNVCGNYNGINFLNTKEKTENNV